MSTNLMQLISETKQSYYEYALKLEGGCEVIINAFRSGDISTGINGIQSLSEGLAWMIDAESLLEIHSYKIESPINKITPLFERLNAALASENFEVVSSLLEDELKPVFKGAENWVFEEIIS